LQFTLSGVSKKKTTTTTKTKTIKIQENEDAPKTVCKKNYEKQFD